MSTDINKTSVSMNFIFVDSSRGILKKVTINVEHVQNLSIKNKFQTF